MDELSAFKAASDELLDLETKLFSIADVVFTGGRSLHASKCTRHSNVICFPSSIDFDHFSQARGGRLLDPPDQAAIPTPRIGFFGVIDERMNLDLVAEVARLRASWQLVMLGPLAKIDRADLPIAPNLHWLGQKDYRELPAYLAGWQAGWMPFAINDATRFISPTKTPEFLAAGLPVVSTPIVDVVRPYGKNGLVAIADNAAGIVAELEQAMTCDPLERTARADAFLRGTSWDRTYAEMKQRIDACARTSRIQARRAAIVEGLAHV